jgi:hypothetical protein
MLPMDGAAGRLVFADAEGLAIDAVLGLENPTLSQRTRQGWGNRII